MNDPTRPTFPDRRPDSGAQDPGIVDLLGRLTQQGAHLAREQVSLMQAEVREAAQDIKAAVAAIAVAAVIGVAGLGVLLMGIAYYVSRALDNLPLGTTLVGAVTLLVALVLYLSGRKKVGASHLKPERTLGTLSDTPAAATGELHHNGAR